MHWSTLECHLWQVIFTYRINRGTLKIKHRNEINYFFNDILTCDLFFLQVGYDMTKRAAEKCFEQAGLQPTDVDVIELHDCFSVNELITYEALGLCPEGNSISEDHCFNKMGSVKNIFLASSYN